MFIKIDENRVINSAHIVMLARDTYTGACQLLLHTFDNANDVIDITPAAYDYISLALEADTAYESSAPAPDINPKSKLAQIYRDSAEPFGAATAAAHLNDGALNPRYSETDVMAFINELLVEGVLRQVVYPGGAVEYVHANKSAASAF